MRENAFHFFWKNTRSGKMYATGEVITNIMKHNKDDLLTNFIVKLIKMLKVKYTSATIMIQHVCDMLSTEDDAIKMFNIVLAEMFSNGIFKWQKHQLYLCLL